MTKKDTIAAIATGMTDSGIGIVRISGVDAVGVGNSIFQSVSGKKVLENAQSHMLYYGFAADGDFVIDEVMAVVMKAPRSFTGENVVEIQCHGGVLVMRKILETALKYGARLAEPGEFTKRAFLNGRIDLSRAEAVMDVIQSQNDTALISSVNQLRGALSEKIRNLRDKIIYEIAFIESALDDPEHISLEGYPENLLEKVDKLAEETRKLISTADNGRLIKEGIRTVIVGKPNAGKSSFLNFLVGEDRAIVTDIAGTTRDALQETVRLGDISLNVVDTAGIRESEDAVEKIGVEKARKYAKEADLIVYVVDTSVPLDENDRDIVSIIKEKNSIVVLNKSDLENVVTEEEVNQLFQDAESKIKELESLESRSTESRSIESRNIESRNIESRNIELKNIESKNTELKNIESKNTESRNIEVKNIELENIKNVYSIRKKVMIKVSLKDNVGLEQFEDAVKNIFFQGKLKSSSEIIITNLRHKEALQEAYDSLMLVKESIENGMPEDFYSIDLMNAYGSLGRIIGEEVGDDLVEQIFSKFCMGK